MIRFIRCVSASIIFILMIVLATPAWADCANPVGVVGDVIWSAVSESPAYCDGTTWHAFPKGKEVESWAAPSQFPVLNNSTPHISDFFGYSVAIDGNTVVVGAYQDESDGEAGVSAAGRAYVFNATTGALVSTLNNSSPHATDNFGYSVAIDGNVAVVGAHMDESDGGAGVSAAAALRHRVRRAISCSIQRTVSCNIAKAMRGWKSGNRMKIKKGGVCAPPFCSCFLF